MSKFNPDHLTQEGAPIPHSDGSTPYPAAATSAQTLDGPHATGKPSLQGNAPEAPDHFGNQHVLNLGDGQPGNLGGTRQRWASDAEQTTLGARVKERLKGAVAAVIPGSR